MTRRVIMIIMLALTGCRPADTGRTANDFLTPAASEAAAPGQAIVPAADFASTATLPAAVPITTVASPTPALPTASTLTATAPPTSPAAAATSGPASTPRATATADPSVRAGQIITRGGAAMVAVPAGEFRMGSQGDPFTSGSETPQHLVYLDAFWLDRDDVTNALYARCVTAGACAPPVQRRSNARAEYYGSADFADYPVLYVSWSDAKAFCGWAGKRLPSEAEWEKAARGTDGRIYPWGSTFDARRLNSAEAGPGDTSRVGSFPDGASAYGALDMAGNAWQWVVDVYQSDYYRLSPAINPAGPASSLPPSEATGVLRGGAWNNNQGAVRSAYRLGYFQRHVGFEATIRCAG